jgi:hypothetical protein
VNGRKAKRLRREVYGDGDPLDRNYRVASDKRGNVIGKFITMNKKKMLAMVTIVADFNRQLYRRLKREAQ